MSAAREEMELQIALFHAIETEDFAKVRKCVRNGVDLSDEWRNEQGLTPLELARSKTNSKIEAFIFEECSLYTAIICLPMTISGYTRTDVLLDKDFYSLRAACSNGDSETVRRFIESGVDINKTDVHTRGYLWAACENDHLEIVEMLLKADADPNDSPQALAVACWYNHLDVIKVLIRAGANE
ncbi:protein fem-1 homolog C-like [Oscarella lobularis]|uniref:protein fem-1 homolog C-like n=1 Tax=Oscarella lobularis TaxID=121494 RepID=UPI003313DC78